MSRKEDIISEAVERARAEIERAKQPRITDPDKVFSSVYEWVRDVSLDAPLYATDNRKRDQWLRIFAKKEPHLYGILTSVVSIDKNRGWMMEGSEQQVKRYTNIFHNVENGRGWRELINYTAMAYYSSDIGALFEIEREGKPTSKTLTPLNSMYYVDPGRARLRPGNRLNYFPPGQKMQVWEKPDYFRVASMYSNDETFLGLGYCAISRCIDFARLMIAVYRHDMGELGAESPAGIMLLKNITQSQWDTAMEARSELASSYEKQYYGNLALIASESPEDIDVKLIALSNIPKGFNKQTTVNALMYAYALNFEYDPREFWPVSGGQLGTATETDTQHRKATGKGGMNFVLGVQEHIQNNLPESLHFEFEQRDVAGELSDVQLLLAKIDVIAKMASIKASKGPKPPEEGEKARALPPVEKDDETEDLSQTNPTNPPPIPPAPPSEDTAITREEVRVLLAKAGAIPTSWTEYEEEVSSSDTSKSDELEELRSRPSIRRSASRFPQEPIVRYRWPLNQSTVLFESGEEVLRRKFYPSAEIASKPEPAPETVFYSDTDLTITETDVTEAVGQLTARYPLVHQILSGEWRWDEAQKLWVKGKVRLDHKTLYLISQHMAEDSRMVLGGFDMARSTSDLSEWEQDVRAEIKAEYIRQYLIARGGRENMTMSDWGRLGGVLKNQYKHLTMLYEQRDEHSEAQLNAYVRQYASSARQMFERGKAASYHLNMPAYPGDGSSECRGNCGCEWIIEETPQGHECTWVLGKKDNCDTCLDRSIRWAPIVL
jgi:hypothetical protein